MRLKDFHIIVVSGTREWADAHLFSTSLKRRLISLKNTHKSNLLVVSGEASGIDTLTRRICEDEGIWFVGVPAPWKLFHAGAGPKRNEFMLDIFQPNLLIACHPDLKNSKGTKNCVKLARERGIVVEKLR